MSSITHIFRNILEIPLINLLILAYDYLHSMGLAIIALTVLVRLLLTPSFTSSMRQQKDMAALQPKLNELREKHKEDKVAQSQAMMELYKEHKVNPLGSCLPLIIQLIVLVALYRVFILGLGNGSLRSYLYSFVHDPGTINPYFLHFLNLGKPSWFLGVLAAITQYFQSKMMLPTTPTTDPTAKALQTQTLYIFPIITLLFSLRFQAGLPLYWLVNTLYSIAQQWYIMRGTKPVTPTVLPG